MTNQTAKDKRQKLNQGLRQAVVVSSHSALPFVV
jgi:hypothetical protein